MERLTMTGVEFIDVGPKPVVVKEEKEDRPSSPDETLSELQAMKCKINNVGENLHCAECSYKTTSPEKMLRHIRRIHRGQNPYQCNYCDYSTYNSKVFEEHVNIHKGVKPYKCQYCTYATVSKKYIKDHERRHATCPTCNFLARNRKQLKKHIDKNNCGDMPELKVEGNYPCVFCGKIYAARGSRGSHYKQRKACYICGALICTQALMKAHMTEKHDEHLRHEEKKKVVQKAKFSCQLCDWKSSHTAKILMHLIHHPDQTVDESIDISPLVKMGIMLDR